MATSDSESAAAHGERLLRDTSPAHKYCMTFSLSVESACASPADTSSSFLKPNYHPIVYLCCGITAKEKVFPYPQAKIIYL